MQLVEKPLAKSCFYVLRTLLEGFVGKDDFVSHFACLFLKSHLTVKLEDEVKDELENWLAEFMPPVFENLLVGVEEGHQLEIGGDILRDATIVLLLSAYVFPNRADFFDKLSDVMAFCWAPKVSRWTRSFSDWF
jgi:hypothetical protein